MDEENNSSGSKEIKVQPLQKPTTWEDKVGDLKMSVWKRTIKALMEICRRMKTSS